MIKFNTDFNKARKSACIALVDTIAEGKAKAHFTEVNFRDTWVSKIQKNEGVVAKGWYTPPPFGMAVLTGLPTHPSRISFDSLRNEPNWPGESEIDWNQNLLYGYCSPVNYEFGMPGDLAITLYFGQDERIVDHFKKTHKATQEVIQALPNLKNSKELFDVSQEIFLAYRLKNCVVSKTDLLPLDLGHTYPCVLSTVNALSVDDCRAISQARQFINPTSTWDFSEGIQFTIEPQLVSLDDVTLPQVTYHYVISKQDGFVVCNDVDALLSEYNLI